MLTLMRHYYSVDAIRDAEAPLLASLPDGALMRRAAFGLATEMMQKLWTGPPAQDLIAGLAAGRFKFRQEQLPSALAMIGGSVMSSMFLVLQGHLTWREAGRVARRNVGGIPDPQERIHRKTRRIRDTLPASPWGLTAATNQGRD